MSDSTLELTLNILTVVLITLTIALVILGIRAENRLNRLATVLVRLLRIQYIHTGSVAERTIEIELSHLTTRSNAIILSLQKISRDAHIRTRIRNGKLVVSYRFMWEDAVLDTLAKCVDDKKYLPPRIYSRLLF